MYFRMLLIIVPAKPTPDRTKRSGCDPAKRLYYAMLLCPRAEPIVHQRDRLLACEGESGGVPGTASSSSSVSLPSSAGRLRPTPLCCGAPMGGCAHGLWWPGAGCC